jgi:hypothetical protein
MNKKTSIRKSRFLSTECYSLSNVLEVALFVLIFDDSLMPVVVVLAMASKSWGGNN